MNFNFEKDYILENDYVKLIPLKLEHTEALFKVSNHKDIWKDFTEDGFGIENFKRYIILALAKRGSKTQYPYVVFDKSENTFAGMTRLYDINNEFGSLKIGHTWYGKALWGSGLNKHCKFLLLQFVFETLGAYRIGFGVSEKNIRSLYAMDNLGAVREGVLRGFLSDNDGRFNIVLYSILKNEWFNIIKHQLSLKLKSFH